MHAATDLPARLRAHLLGTTLLGSLALVPALLVSLPSVATAQDAAPQDAGTNTPSGQFPLPATEADVSEVANESDTDEVRTDRPVTEGSDDARPNLAQAQGDGNSGSSESPLELGTVTVEGEISADEAANTEGTGSYTTHAVTVGGKDAVPVREVPQSVGVTTRQTIEDQNMMQLEDAMRRAAGVRVFANDPGRSSPLIRGFEPDNATVDGLPAPISSIYGTQPDLAIFDRVEVLRGPSGLFAGTGEPGGTINLVRKRAVEDLAIKATGWYGSHDFYRAEADVSAPVYDDGRVRARFVGAFQDNGTFVEKTENRATTVYGTIEADLTDQTTASVALSRMEKNIKPHGSLPAYDDGTLLDIDRSTFFGADWNRFGNEIYDMFADVEHRFDNGIKAKFGARYSDRRVDFKYAQTLGAVTRGVDTTNMRAFGRKYYEDSISVDGHVSVPFEGFGQTHTVTAGVDYRRYDQEMQQGVQNGIATVSIFDLNSDISEPDLTYSTKTRNVTNQYSAYSQLRVKPTEDLSVVLGGRLSFYSLETENLLTGAVTTDNRDSVFTPFAGLTYDLTDNVTTYASYSEVFQPQTQTDSAGNVLEPRVGDQIEIGVKGSFFDDKLTAQLGAFRIQDENRPKTVGTDTEAAGKAESKGVEVEVAGEVLPGWDVAFNYAYLFAEEDTGDPLQSGLPRHTANLWTKYEFGDEMLDGAITGLSLGGGVRAASKIFFESGGLTWTQDAVAIVDAQIGYKVMDTVQATFTVNNMLDTKYYERLGSSAIFNYYGAPRTYMFRLGSAF